MKSLLLSVLLFIGLHDSVVGQPLEEKDDKALLQDLLRQSRDQNRKLEQQMNRMKLIWTGISQMCSALQISPCDCEEKDKASMSTKEEKEKEIDMSSSENEETNETTGTDGTRIILHSLGSGGLQNDGSVSLTVVYSADVNHVVDWKVPYYNDVYEIFDMYRTAGMKNILGKDKYSTSVHVPNVLNASAVVCSFLSGYDVVQLIVHAPNTINVTEQDIHTYDPYQGNISNPEVAPVEDDLVVSLEINEDARESSIVIDTNVFFTGLNTETSPPQLFEIWPYNDTILKVSGRRGETDDTSWLDITVPQRYTKFGGILSVLFPTGEPRYENLVENVLQGFGLYIRSPVTKEVIPENGVGLLPLKQETLIYKEQQTLNCIGMGNPRPYVKLFKHVRGGRRKLVKSENYAIDHLTQFAIYTVNMKEVNSAKNFTCRAESGNTIVEETTLVKKLVPMQFDTDKTGLMKNTSEKMMFGCKASWESNPDLSFRLYSVDGPELIGDDNITLATKKIGPKTTKLTMTVSPRNDAIHTVYCIAKVARGMQQLQHHRLIELFPGTYAYWDWQLYERLSSNTTRSDPSAFYIPH